MTPKLDSLKSEKTLQAMYNADASFYTDSKCNACGICSKACPVDNIVINKKPEYQHHCINCYACVHNCPKNAIHIKGEKSVARFRNAKVTVNEILSANGKG